MSRRSGGFLLDGSGIGSLEGGSYSANHERERGRREKDAGYERERSRQSHNYPEPSTTYSRPQSEREAEERDTVDLPELPAHSSETDPARIISLAQGLSETRRRGATLRGVSSSRRLPDILDEREASNDFWNEQGLGPAAQSGSHVDFANVGGRARTASPASFLVGTNNNRRSVSAGTLNALGRQLSPLNPSIASPPPPAGGTTGKQNFSPVSPLPLPPPVAPYQQLQSKRSALAQHQQQLREFREQYQPTEATLQRALKARQQLELSSLYKRLLTIYPTQDLLLSSGSAHGTPNKGDTAGPYSRERIYNPLMTIRNKRFRNRERIKLELSSWDDPGAVEQWIEDLAIAIHEHLESGKIGLPRLPPPPHPSGRVEEKRARMDWVISPQELLADFYWMEESERLRMEQTQQMGGEIEEEKKQERQQQRESHLNLRSLIDREERRAGIPSQVRKRSIRDMGDIESGDDITRRDTGDSSKKRSRSGFMERQPSLQPGIQLDNDVGYHSAYTSQEDSSHSSESGGTYDDEMSGVEIDSDIDQKAKKKQSKRKKLGKIITSAKPSRRKKAKKKRISDTHVLSPEEKRKRQEQEEMEWMVEMGDGIPGPRRSYSGGEDADPVTTTALAKATADKITGVKKIGTGLSLPTTLGGSRSSLERFGSTRAPVGRRSLDFGEIVVPSIAISLSPPRVTSRGEDEDMDSRGRTKKKDEMEGTSDNKRKASPTKKLFEKGTEAMGREKEPNYDDMHKESMDSDSGRKLKDKDKDGSTMGRVKSRVEKIRNEVAKVEDFIWRRDAEKGGSALPSPTGSIFAEAESSGYRSEDDRGRLMRENTFSGSEAEDEGRRSKGKHGRSSLEVPEGRVLRPSRFGSHSSTSALPAISKAGIRDDYTDVSSDEEGRRRRNQKLKVNLEPTRSYISRDPSPARETNIQSIGDRNGVESGAVTLRGNDNNGPRLEKRLPIIGNSDGKEVVVSKQELMRARAYLLASGVVARGITSKRAGTTVLGRISNTNDGVGIVVLAKQHMHSTDVVSREIANAEEELVKKSRMFTTSTVAELKGLVDNIRHEIETRLAAMLGEVADGADELNGELTTKCTLAVKAVNDDLSNVMRRKRRKFRWIRRAGYVMLEWVVLGVMWWVWLIVVVIRFLRVTVTGVVRGVRWILWI
ncbi:hypothetical protein L873DRAFT_1691584 [Choiromyces venosus 120613-1]|uniref:Uncharacterized protein n=1 Tax=Choiromyces venosus 120613-1 TaxID=1336337 RepID=A0A3N4JKG8_9PEZI|nr:hypothetical protein L873DRAFT_1691584 [Choiromyces venosus 120613-1]